MPPRPDAPYPLPGQTRLGFLNQFVRNPLIQVGDWTYYDDPEGPDQFERHVLYHFDFIGDRLIIGKFCQIAAGATFVMNGGNHRTDAISTYPFAVFGGDWRGRFAEELHFPNRGDTVIGNDVWLGHDCLIMPGISVGDGTVVATRAVVTADVPPYAVVGGNPARVLRMRFAEAEIETLLALRWWTLPIETITELLPQIGRADVAALAAAIADRAAAPVAHRANSADSPPKT